MSKLISKLALKALLYALILFGIQKLMINEYPMVEPFFPSVSETLDASFITETGRNTWTITAELSELESNPLRNEAGCLLIYLAALDTALMLFLAQVIGGLFIIATAQPGAADEEIDDVISILF